MNGAVPDPISKTDRDALLRHVRNTERVGLAGIQQVAAERLAQFERQLATEYGWDTDEVWQQAFEDARAVVEEARPRILARFRELGVPEEFAGHLEVAWSRQGRNVVTERRQELRQVARARAEADRKAGEAALKRRCLEVEGAILGESVSSDRAARLLAAIPTPEQLLPELTVPEIESLLPGHLQVQDDRKRLGYAYYGRDAELPTFRPPSSVPALAPLPDEAPGGQDVADDGEDNDDG